jgi:hypothetical protein
MTQGIKSPTCRRCAFINAVAEHPDPEHPERQAVLTHRQWFLDTVAHLLAQIRKHPPKPPHSIS